MLSDLNTVCAIVAAGEIADYAPVKEALSSCEFLICADGGLRHLDAMGLTPDLLLGDFDSTAQIPDNIPTVRHQKQKDYTDSMLAVREAVDRGFRRLLLVGMLGGRLDHTLGNLQALGWCSLRGIEACLWDGATTVLALTTGILELAPKPDCYFSLIPLSGLCRGVTIQNARFPLEQYELRFYDPRAISNEFLDTPAIITVKSGTVAVIVTPKG